MKTLRLYVDVTMPDAVDVDEAARVVHRALANGQDDARAKENRDDPDCQLLGELTLGTVTPLPADGPNVRFALYDTDAEELVSTDVYTTRDEATDAIDPRMGNVIVVDLGDLGTADETCGACGSELCGGYCANATCPLSEHEQTCAAYCGTAAIEIDRAGRVVPTGRPCSCHPFSQTVQTALLLTHLKEVPLVVIESWTHAQRTAAADWAAAVHLSASDNDDVAVPPMPEFLKPYETPPGTLPGEKGPA